MLAVEGGASACCMRVWEQWRHTMFADSTPLRADMPIHLPAGRHLWPATLAVCAATLVAAAASPDYYLIEDGSPLTPAAYAASALLRVSYDAIYATALAAGVAALLVFARAAASRAAAPAALDLLALPLALLLALGG